MLGEVVDVYSTDTAKQGEWDNTKRGLRVAIKGLIAFLGSGVLNAWAGDYFDQWTGDTVIRLIAFAIVAFVVSTLIDVLEDVSGSSLLGLQPTDRKAGDALIGDGVGAKTGEIVNDLSPTIPTTYVEPKTP